jgi:methylaspartate mutase epsilon subunit
MAIYMARGVRLNGHPDYEREKELILREARAIVDAVLEMGGGDVAIGTVRAIEAGVLDIPWSPNRYVKGRVMPARDADGYLRIFDPAAMPFPRDILEHHRECLQRRARRDGRPFDIELAVSSVYEMSEGAAKLLPFRLK